MLLQTYKVTNGICRADGHEQGVAATVRHDRSALFEEKVQDVGVTVLSRQEGGLGGPYTTRRVARQIDWLLLLTLLCLEVTSRQLQVN